MRGKGSPTQCWQLITQGLERLVAGGGGGPGVQAGPGSLPQPSVGLTEILAVRCHGAWHTADRPMTRERLCPFQPPGTSSCWAQECHKKPFGNKSDCSAAHLLESISLRDQERIQRVCLVAGMGLQFPDYSGLQLILKAPQVLETCHSPTPRFQRKVTQIAAPLFCPVSLFKPH